MSQPNRISSPSSTDNATKPWWHDRIVLLKLILMAVLFIGFAYVAKEVRDNETINFDRSVLLFFHDHRNGVLDQIVPMLTNFGGAIFVVLFTACLSGYYIYTKRRSTAFRVIASIGGAAALNLVLKAIFERSRPDLWHQIVTEHGFSFPSGHAMASSALAATVISIFWYGRARYITLVLGMLYVLLIGMSRLYLGVHYPTDILAGWIVSIGWVLVVNALIRDHHRHSLRQSRVDPEASTSQ